MTIRKATSRTHESGRTSKTFKGPVRTPSAVLGRGYCLQTAHLESRRYGYFARGSANLLNYRGRVGSQRMVSVDSCAREVLKNGHGADGTDDISRYNVCHALLFVYRGVADSFKIVHKHRESLN